MGQFADIYVAVKTRSKQQGINFLNHFLPNRVESADEYEFPQYSSNSEIEFDSVNDLMNHLETEKFSDIITLYVHPKHAYDSVIPKL